MKYFLTALITAIVVFSGATLYYKGLPKFASPSGLSVVSTEEGEPILSSPTPIPTSGQEKEDLAKIIKSALVAKHGSASASLNVTVTTIEGNFAKGMASEQGGGGIWFAAKVGDSWKLVWDGNGVISCNEINPYPNFPKSLIPECFATSSGKLITR